MEKPKSNLLLDKVFSMSTLAITKYLPKSDKLSLRLVSKTFKTRYLAESIVNFTITDNFLTQLNPVFIFNLPIMTCFTVRDVVLTEKSTGTLREMAKQNSTYLSKLTFCNVSLNTDEQIELDTILANLPYVTSLTLRGSCKSIINELEKAECYPFLVQLTSIQFECVDGNFEPLLKSLTKLQSLTVTNFNLVSVLPSITANLKSQLTFLELSEVGFSCDQSKMELTEFIESQRNLIHLRLRGLWYDEVSFLYPTIRNLTNLEEVDLRQSKHIFERSVACSLTSYLGEKGIKVNLSHCRMNDKHLELLLACSKGSLEELVLDKNMLTKEAISVIIGHQEKLQCLKILSLKNNNKIEESGFEQLLENVGKFRSLVVIDFGSCLFKFKSIKAGLKKFIESDRNEFELGLTMMYFEKNEFDKFMKQLCEGDQVRKIVIRLSKGKGGEEKMRRILRRRNIFIRDW